MDRLSALKAFVATVEAEGFAAAARALGTSRSAISRAIQALEDDLGVQLLHRTTRAVAPTVAGAAFYRRAADVLEALGEAEREVRDTGDTAGTLRLNAPMSFGIRHVGPAIADFMAAHPQIRIELHLSDRFVDLIEDGYDLVLRIAEPREDTTLVDYRLCVIHSFACASREHVAAHGAPDTPHDLRTRPCLHYGHLASGTRWRLIGPDGAPSVVRINALLCSNNGEVLRDAALAGLGIALLPSFIIGAELQTGRLVRVLPDHRAPDLTLAAIHPPTRHPSAKIRLLTDFLMRRFGDRPYWDLVS